MNKSGWSVVFLIMCIAFIWLVVAAYDATKETEKKYANYRFDTGNTVQLTSGGPKMTVLDVDDLRTEGLVTCSWFDSTGRLHNDFFHVEMLKFVQ